jgi:hypothetical protein
MAENPYALALELGHGPNVAVLAHEESDAQRVRGGDDAQTLEAFRQAVMHLHRVGDADLGLAAVDHGDNHLVAGGGLHQHVHAGLFLQHLGHRRGGGVIERARRQGGEAVGLRLRRRCRERCAAEPGGNEDSHRRKRPAFGDELHELPSVGVFWPWTGRGGKIFARRRRPCELE